MSTAALSTAALAKELAGPGAGAVMGTRPPCSWGKSPFGRMYPDVWVPDWPTAASA